MKQHVISMKEGTLSGYGQHLAPFLPHSRCSVSFGCTSYIRCIPLRLAFLPFPVGMLNLEYIPGYSGPTHAFMDSPQPQPPGRLWDATAEFTQFKQDGTQEGSGQVPSIQKILSWISFLPGPRQKCMLRNGYDITGSPAAHLLCSPRGSNIWYVVQRALIILEQRDRKWNFNPATI